MHKTRALTTMQTKACPSILTGTAASRMAVEGIFIRTG